MKRQVADTHTVCAIVLLGLFISSPVVALGLFKLALLTQ